MYRNVYEKNIIIIIQNSKNLKIIIITIEKHIFYEKPVYLFYIRSTHTFIFIKFK